MRGIVVLKLSLREIVRQRPLREETFSGMPDLSDFGLLDSSEHFWGTPSRVAITNSSEQFLSQHHFAARTFGTPVDGGGWGCCLCCCLLRLQQVVHHHR